MSTIVTRAGKGSPLTHAEVDANFTNLDTDKLDTAGIALGSAASPTIKFTGDTNTGIYSPGADQVAVSTGGTARFRINSGGNVALGPTLPAAAWSEFVVAGNAALQAAAPVFNFVNAAGSARFAYIQHTGTGGDLYLLNQEAGAVRFGTNNAERARIDSSGRLLVGTSTSRSSRLGLTNFNALLQIESNTEAAQAITRWSADVSSSRLHLQKGRGTIAAPTAVAAEDILGEVAFSGYDSANMSNGAQISALVDGNPGANDMPGRLVFSTTADGAATSTERLRITNDGVRAYNQLAPAAVNATATLTVANLKAGIITSTSAAATDMTLPTGTDTQAGFSGTYDNMAFEWSVINTGPSLVRVLAGTAHTVVGSGSVATGTSGRFASRRTAANTFVTYRLT